MLLKKSLGFKDPLLISYIPNGGKGQLEDFTAFTSKKAAASKLALTNSQPITKVVQPISHDHHPGQGRYPGVLQLLARVALAVAVGVVVLVVVVVQNVMVVVVMVAQTVCLPQGIVQMRMAFVSTAPGHVFIVSLLLVRVSDHHFFFLLHSWLLRNEG